MQLNKLMMSLASVSMLGLVACGDTSQKKQAKFIDPANMDTTISPADNFFLYANGTWLKNTEIPGHETRWGSFDELRDRTSKDVKGILEAAAQNKTAPTGSNEKVIGNFFKSGMDTVTINEVGLKPIQHILDRIDAITNAEELLDEVAKQYVQGISSFIGGYIGPDQKIITKNVVRLSQTGLGLPSKDYYVNQDEKTKTIRKQYKKYIADLLQKTGINEHDANQVAIDIYALEERFANASYLPAEMRDPHLMYNKFTLEEFSAKTPGIDWRKFFNAIRITSEDTLIVGTVSYYQEVANQLQATPIDTWKKYIKFHTLKNLSPYLSDEFANLRFEFYGKQLSGQKEQTPRWKQVLSVIDGAVGDRLGQLYVEKHFKPEAKERMLELVNNLQVTFHERIEKLDWMSDITKQKAIAKLNTFVKKIGYPDKWKDYSGLEIVDNNYLQNVLAASEFEYNYEVSKLGKDIDKSEWFMTPHTVNAYYYPIFNEIAFPAAILQFPFFDFNADDAINYGGIGAVIGHEMTHGFDDKGCQYDAEGYLRNWWTVEDAAQFGQRTKIVKEQFDNYTVLDGIAVNGDLTLGENIADLGGVTIAYEAFKKTKQGQSQELIDGFTPDQRFFLSWAQIWRGKATPERTRQLINTDPHSPGEWRCNGPLSNFEPFYDAFGIKEGDNMWRSDDIRAKIW